MKDQKLEVINKLETGVELSEPEAEGYEERRAVADALTKALGDKGGILARMGHSEYLPSPYKEMKELQNVLQSDINKDLEVLGREAKAAEEYEECRVVADALTKVLGDKGGILARMGHSEYLPSPYKEMKDLQNVLQSEMSKHLEVLGRKAKAAEESEECRVVEEALTKALGDKGGILTMMGNSEYLPSPYKEMKELQNVLQSEMRKAAQKSNEERSDDQGTGITADSLLRQGVASLREKQGVSENAEESAEESAEPVGPGQH